MEGTLDLSIILCLHREGSLLTATLQSLRDAIFFTRADGLNVELVGVLDDPDALTKAALVEWSAGLPCSVQIIEVNNKSLGLSRNAGSAAAHGEWICFADGDDLISYNTFSTFYSWARRWGPRVVLMPEWLLTFGGRASVNLVLPLRLVGPLNLLTSNPFVSRICLHRSAIGRTQFVNADPQNGYAYEDWHHHCEMIACGYDVQPAPGTILFYRLRDNSLSAFSEKFSSRAIPPSSLFEPDVFLHRCQDDYKSYRSDRGGECGGLLLHRQSCGGVLETSLITAAHRIEAAIGLSLTELPVATPLSEYHKSAGSLYFRLCHAIRDTAVEHVFITGGNQRQFFGGYGLFGAGTNQQNQLMLSFRTDAKPNYPEFIHRQGRAQITDANIIIEISHDHKANEAICLKAIQSLFGSQTRISIGNDEFGSAFCRRFGHALGISEGFDSNARINLVDWR
ncbi:MAG: glycosyltransferase family 2 protein [Xanthobacteraceae bacterium]|nr:glycosyltransferase family 2 protein [Xanthobacteraceae bacterium]MBV9627875.1 glycosyltransferase family 2 protein [Xanthobacteraceae bacterium]